MNPDGSITVTPVHEYFGYKLDGNGNLVQDLSFAQGGSVLHGHPYLGRVVAGVTPNHPTTEGDYDGNGTTDKAVYRPTTGQWFVRGATPEVSQYGTTNPVPGDYDGDGTTDKAVYRPSTGQWFVQGGSPEVTQYGATGDIALPLPYAVRRVFFPQERHDRPNPKCHEREGTCTFRA